MKRYLSIFIFLLLWTVPAVVMAQKPKQKFSMSVLKDSLDGKLDMSDFLIDFHGFIPVPQLITEPALGSIGGVFTPIFIQPNKHQEPGRYIPPDVTAGFVGYTGNKSWGFGAVRIASLPKQHLKYRVAVFHGDVNMDFYRDFPVIGERELGFNLKTNGFFVSLLRQISDTELYMGLDYSFAHINARPDFGLNEVPSFLEDKELSSNISTISPDIQFDKRDNVFTPNKGVYLLSTYRINAKWTGSDYNYQKLNVAGYKFMQPTSKWVSGVRLEGVWQFGDPPFYAKPSIDMRGVPMARYQGDQVYMVETEQRYDFSLRWSGILIAGMAKAPSHEVSFSDADLVYNYGGGFRYLIARKFGLRTGIDVAWSNDDFGWYIVFGHAWNNRN
ncbi:outer membrane protein/protective antigen OMA87 [Echinicola vietnamensis DSM 17526]|uniref:Outer membrane protein/protective antigen OMA87 n=2 Tax=Echinicola TaxID=390846 RepID=L0G0I3_ECHVK|nr:outer membrane protein/protective antigen OMA87 [Echinicola vietnamensis DSM 17526]